MAQGKWWDSSKIRSYQQVAEYYKTCRSPAKGKPLRSWGRIFKTEDGNFSFHAVGYNENTQIGILTPDDVFTFTLAPHVARNTCAITLAQSLYRAIPIMWQRAGIAKYRVQHTSKLPMRNDRLQELVDWSYMRKVAPLYFQGMQFNLKTGECVNAKPDVITKINEDKRKEWLTSLRRFKLTVKTMAKIGAFDKAVKDAHSSKTYRGQVPEWSDPSWLNLLYESIRDNTCPQRLVLGIASQGIHTNYWRSKDMSVYEVILSGLEYICTTYSMDLRRKFGVFNEMSELPIQDEVSGNQMGQPEQAVMS
jgi:hypothetical protein